jgi:phosphoribosylamine--glycine ligase
MPTVKGMQSEGHPYTGFLYAGLMISPDGIPKVIEYNCRFGDPETQPIMMRLKSDLAALCLSAINKELATTTAEWDERPALGVVLAAGGYPESYPKGDVISGLELCDTDACKTFHAGTALSDGQVVTAGGRVLCVTALGTSVTEAQQLAYKSAKMISWEKMYLRNDIGHRAIARETEK